MAKPQIKATRSCREGHVALRVAGSAQRFGASVSSTIAVDLDLEAAMAFAAELATAITKTQDKMRATADREARRKVWRDREVAAGRMKIVPASEFFKR